MLLKTCFISTIAMSPPLLRHQHSHNYLLKMSVQHSLWLVDFNLKKFLAQVKVCLCPPASDFRREMLNKLCPVLIAICTNLSGYNVVLTFKIYKIQYFPYKILGTLRLPIWHFLTRISPNTSAGVKTKILFTSIFELMHSERCLDDCICA